MDKQLICNLIQENVIEYIKCETCGHQSSHLRTEECVYSMCDRVHIRCGCIPLLKDWDV